MPGPTPSPGTADRAPEPGGPRPARTPLPLKGALKALGILLVLPAACASAQGPPPDAPATPGPEEVIRAPDFTGTPGTRVSWVEGGLRDDETEPPVLVVRGRGEVEVDPDRARVSFAVETEAGSAREAAEENARSMTRVLEAVRSAGGELPGFRVGTSGYSLTPRYQTPSESRLREIAGYTARNHVVVTVDRVDEVGRLMDAALQSGANRMAGLQFTVRDPEPHREAALREAVRKARSEARIMAEALGMRLGPPIHVDGGAELPTPRPMAELVLARAAFADAPPPPTPVEAGTQTVTAQVTIRFRLEPPR